MTFTHVWFWRKWRGDRKGQDCRVVTRANGTEKTIVAWGAGPFGKMFKGLTYSQSPRNILVEFVDGEKVIAPRFAVGRRKR